MPSEMDMRVWPLDVTENSRLFIYGRLMSKYGTRETPNIDTTTFTQPKLNINLKSHSGNSTIYILNPLKLSNLLVLVK